MKENPKDKTATKPKPIKKKASKEQDGMYKYGVDDKELKESEHK